MSAPAIIFFPQKYPEIMKKYGTAKRAAWFAIRRGFENSVICLVAGNESEVTWRVITAMTPIILKRSTPGMRFILVLLARSRSVDSIMQIRRFQQLPKRAASLELVD
jgi:hypothetical protein